MNLLNMSLDDENDENNIFTVDVGYSSMSQEDIQKCSTVKLNTHTPGMQ